MMQSIDPEIPVVPRRPSLAARIAWWAGWVILAIVSMAVTYGALVYGGR
jgi:hypothetical protein